MKEFIEKLKSKAKTLVDNSEYYTAVELSDAIEICKEAYEQGIKEAIEICEDYKTYDLIHIKRKLRQKLGGS